MTTNEKIKMLRTQLRISQEELARLTGYTDRSSIAKIEAGKVELTESKIVSFAQALGVSPSYLMGLSDDIPVAVPAPAAISDEDLQFALFGGRVSEEAFAEVKRFAAFVAQQEKEKAK